MGFEDWLKSRALSWALSTTEVVNMKAAWNAATDEAVKVANELYAHHYDHSGQKQGAEDAAEKIKELKEK